MRAAALDSPQLRGSLLTRAAAQGDGRGGLGAFNKAQYDALATHMQEEPMRDANAWCASLMDRDALVAVRVLEVREAYSRLDFEWDQLQRLTREGIETTNKEIMRAHASRQFTSTLEGDDDAGVNAPRGE